MTMGRRARRARRCLGAGLLSACLWTYVAAGTRTPSRRAVGDLDVPEDSGKEAPPAGQRRR